jgi:hypothetical protein
MGHRGAWGRGDSGEGYARGIGMIVTDFMRYRQKNGHDHGFGQAWRPSGVGRASGVMSQPGERASRVSEAKPVGGASGVSGGGWVSEAVVVCGAAGRGHPIIGMRAAA